MIKEHVNGFFTELKMKFGFDTEVFKAFASGEQPVTDISTDYSLHGVGSFKLKLFDTKFLIDGVSYFRPLIRGFLVFLMFLYNVKQIIGFFGYNAGVVAGRSDVIETSIKKQRGE